MQEYPQEYPLIGIVMATHLEAKPFLGTVVGADAEDAPFPLYRGKGLALVVSGIGKANTAMAIAYMCMALRPASIVNLGSAGATRHGFEPGSIYHIEEAIEYDRRNFTTGKPFQHFPDLLDGFGRARVATSDCPVIYPDDRKLLAPIAELVDMEGAAVIQAARKFKVPCYLFKYVSDTPAHTRGREIPICIRRFRTPFFEYFKNDILPVLKTLHESGDASANQQ